MKKKVVSLLIAMLMVLSIVTVLPITAFARPPVTPPAIELKIEATPAEGGSLSYEFPDGSVLNTSDGTIVLTAENTGLSEINVDTDIDCEENEGYIFWRWLYDSVPLYETGYAEGYVSLLAIGSHTLTAEFQYVGTPGPSYAITNGTADDAHGTITLPEKAAENDTVTVTVNPAEGYQLKSLKYNDGSNDFDITKDATSGNYQFTMPAKDVTVTATFEAASEQPHTHDYENGLCSCGLHNGDHTGWTAWGNGDKFQIPDTSTYLETPAVAGNYYLTEDVSVTSWQMLPCEINLCLNGYKLTTEQGVIIGSGSTLNLYDCNGADLTYNGYLDANLWKPDAENAHVDAADEYDITGGLFLSTVNVTKGVFNMYGGTIAGISANHYGAAVMISSEDAPQTGVFNMHGGAIIGNKSSKGGGGVYVAGTMTMDGGEIACNTVANNKNGAGIYVSGSDASFTMTGGKVHDNLITFSGYAQTNYEGYGAGVYVSGGNFELGGTAEITGNILSGTTGRSGAGVCLYNGGNLVMTGGKIAGNSAAFSSYGGGVYVGNGCDFDMLDGEITGNTVSGYGYGGGVYNYGTFTMAGGEISGNALNNSGGGVYNGGTFTMTGGTITGNTGYSSAAGVYTQDTMYVGGTAVVQGNYTCGTLADNGLYVKDTDNTDSILSNVYNRGTLGILSGDDAPATGMDIGLFYSEYLQPGATTTEYGVINASKGDEKYFTSDEELYAVVFYEEPGEDSGEVRFARGGFDLCDGGDAFVWNGDYELWEGELYYTLSTAFDEEFPLGFQIQDFSAEWGYSLADYTFDGWYTERTGGTKLGDELDFTKDAPAWVEKGVTYYAHWKNPAGNTVLTETLYLNMDEENPVLIGGKAYDDNDKLKEFGLSFDSDTNTMTAKDVSVTVVLNPNTYLGNDALFATMYTGGVYVGDGATFILESGNISGNADQASAFGGGAVSIIGGTFIMNGGVIESNAIDGNNYEALGGGAVFVGAEGEFTMNGGALRYNMAMNGGAVFVAADGTFTLHGGLIENNYAQEVGGGVCVELDGTLIADGGSIIGNFAYTAGSGVYVAMDYSGNDPFLTCLAAGTPITLADGTRIAIEDLKVGDLVRVFDHETGALSTAKLLSLYKFPEKKTGAFTLSFTNGVEVTAVGGHCFFEKSESKYVVLTPENAIDYIGCEFYNADTASWETLTGVEVLDEAVDTYVAVTEKHLNLLANGMLSNVDGLYAALANVFEMDENLKIDEEKKAEDIEKYGLWEYSEEKFPNTSEYAYEAQNLQYLGIAFGKGILTEEDLETAIEYGKTYKAYLESLEEKSGKPRMLLMGAAPKPAPGIYLGGTVRITGNYYNGEFPDNLFMWNAGPLVTILTPADGMRVDVTLLDYDSQNYTEGAFTTNGTEELLKYFYSDNLENYVAYNAADSGYLEMKAPSTVPGSEEYIVNIVSGDGGVVYADNQAAKFEDTVTVTVLTDDGYMFTGLSVEDAYGNPIEVTNNTFEMPASNVIVTATFEVIVAEVTIDGETTSYVSIDETIAAINASETDCTLTLLADLPESSWIALEIQNEIAVTIDLNGFAILVPGSTFSGINAESGSSVTVTITDSSADKTGYVYDVSLLEAIDELTITDGHFKGDISAYGDIIIAGGKFEGDINAGGDVIVRGGWFKEDPADCYEIAKGYRIDYDENDEWYKVSIITYAITVDTTDDNGSVDAAEKAAEEKTVEITVTPDSGYGLDTLTVTYNDGNGDQTCVVTPDGTDPTKFTFEMPAYPVTVKATFKEKASSFEAEASYTTVVYDGESHNVTVTVTTVPENFPYTLSYSTSADGPFVAADEFTAPKNVSDSCTIYVKVDVFGCESKIVSADVTILPRYVVVVAGSDEKVFDDTPLTYSDYSESEEDELEKAIEAYGEEVGPEAIGFIGEDGILLLFMKDSSMITDVGTVDNEIDTENVEFTESTDLDNYVITYVKGTLEVTAISIDVPTAEGDLCYNGEEQTGVVAGTGYSLIDNKATDAGDYTATATLENGYCWADGSTDAKEIKWSIAKAPVTAPENAGSKGYTGNTLTADVDDTDTLYTVMTNDGGTAVGDYDVVLVLNDSDNYKWSDSDAATKTLTFTITKADNSWTTEPKIDGVTYGAAISPVGVAKFGTVTVTYVGTGDTIYNSTTAPTNAGTYKATFSVNATDDYGALTKDVTFTIAKKSIEGATVVYDESKTYNGQEQTFSVTSVTIDGLTATFDVSGNKATDYNDGGYTLTITGNGNYTGTIEKNFTIARASVTVKADDKSKTYGQNDPTFTATVTGLVNGESTSLITFTIARASGDDVNTYTITPSGDATQGNYTVTYETGTFTISKATNAITGLTLSGWTYGAQANTPTATATFGTIVYTYSDSENGTYSEAVPTNAGTYYVKAEVAENANYAGAVEKKSFTITAKSLTNDAIQAIDSQTYTGSEIKPAVVVKDGEKTLTAETDYTVTYSDNLNAGTAKVTVTLKGNYTGTIEKNFTIDKATPYIKTKPEPNDIVYGKKLKDSTLFGGYAQISATNTTGVGGLFEWKLGDTIPAVSDSNVTTYDVTFTPADTVNYNTATCEVTLTVSKATNAITGLTLSGWTYGAQANTPTATATLGMIVYTYSDSENGTYSEAVPTNAGTYYVKAEVADNANYSGAVEKKSFTITAKSLTNDAIQAIDSQTYTGSEIKPAVVVKDGEKTLTAETDYTVTYSDNTNAGTAKVTVTLKGNYTGTIEKNFTIAQKNVSESAMITTADVLVADGSELKPTATVKDGEKTLVEGTDYDLEYTNNILPGTATVTAVFKGNYIGSVFANFVINRSSISGGDTESGDGKQTVEAEIEGGFAPDVVLEVEVVVKEDNEIPEDHEPIVDYDVLTEKHETVATVYDVRLLLNGTEIQPDELGSGTIVTIRMLIPEDLIGKEFRLVHVHAADDVETIAQGEEATVGTYVIDEDGYIVTEIDRFSEFVFLRQDTSVSLWWLWILIALIVISGAGTTYYYVRKKKKNQ